MEPKYSVLICNYSYDSNREKIGKWLNNGIKVLWFGNAKEAQKIKDDFRPYFSALLLQVFTTKNKDKGMIIDGEGNLDLVTSLGKEIVEFNVEQYMIEHCRDDEHIIVEASAGTGKTTVMIDRIMFLLHTISDIKMNEIYMITFTNDATKQMNDRLQDSLMKRYKLTKQTKYLKWLEEQTQMHISTIDSLAYELIGEYGAYEGFIKHIDIRSLIFEKKEIIKDIINENVNSKKSIYSQIGISYYKAVDLVEECWKKITQIGISEQMIKKLKWGETEDEKTFNLQELLKICVNQIDKKYVSIKADNDAIAIDDIMRDLQYILTRDEIPKTDVKIRYLFVDEFQDSDDSQIATICELVKIVNCTLFVVGDIKQSIYRFRGATDVAFDILKEKLKSVTKKKPREYSLVNNYRTSKDILERLDVYFKKWAKRDLLSYKKAVIAINSDKGFMNIKQFSGYKLDKEEFSKVAVELLDDLKTRVESNEVRIDDKTKVVALVRTNRQLIELSKVCREMHIPVSIKTEGAFYESKAVRDFYAMISSFVFGDEPKYLFNYLLTPYAGNIESMSVCRMEELEGDKEKLKDYIDEYLKLTNWEYYYKQFRLRPVMSVIKEMFEKEDIVSSFVRNSKEIKLESEWDENRIIAATYSEAKQYSANLDKLLEILHYDTSEEVDLYDLYSYLKLMIMTNRDEQEEMNDSNIDYQALQIMTVHRAKGLEFDTVILPFTNFVGGIDLETEIIIDKETNKIGWRYIPKGMGEFRENNYFDQLKVEDIKFEQQEETRILYVALTRAINKLVCITSSKISPGSWGALLMECDN